jgi:hypothetical protein
MDLSETKNERVRTRFISRAFVNMVMNLRGSTKCWEFPECPSKCWLLKKASAPWS